MMKPRAGEVEGEAESVRYATGCAEEQHEGEHGGRHATNEEVTEGQVQDHEIKVGSEFPEGWIKEGQEDNEVAVEAQAEDDREQKGTGHQGGPCGPVPGDPPGYWYCSLPGREACGAGWCWAHPEGGLLSSSSETTLPSVGRQSGPQLTDS